MKKAMQLLAQEFESASNRTPQYLQFHRTFKREFTKFLVSIGCEKVEIGKPNHFDMTGFFTYKEQIWYFSISDLRWSKDKMLIRTADSYRDFSGGYNQYAKMDNLESQIKKIVINEQQD